MARVELAPNLIEFDGVARVESGPKLLSAVATEQLLSDEITAKHYSVGARDALGKPIVLGQTFAYLDWLSQEVAWYVYALETMPDELADERGFERGSKYWAEKGVRSTQEEAEVFALSFISQH